ncbi:MAG TPA: 50S ribosomal protein L33 [Candidatus Saccharimonadales bacterium]|nr:50S ribosomal protein L33 [Candidatus Saccharimonadales bacterium]
MAKKNRPFIALECVECHNRNYTTTKNPKNTTDRLVLNKFCRHDGKVTEHRESK